MSYPNPEPRTPNPDLRFPRLKWQCRRGIKELDVLLERYLEVRYSQANTKEIDIFEALLELPDPELLRYCMGYSRPADADTARVIDAIVKPT